MNIGINVDVLINNFDKYFNSVNLSKYINENQQFLLSIKELSENSNKVFIFCQDIYDGRKDTLEYLLIKNNIKFDEIIFFNDNNLNLFFKNRNVHYYVQKNNKLYDSNIKEKSYILTTLIKNYDATCKNEKYYSSIDSITEYIVESTKEYRKHIEDPITVISGVPSIDKLWTRTQTIEQSTIDLNRKMCVCDYIYSNVCNNLDSIALIYFSKKYTYRQIYNNITDSINYLKNIGISNNDTIALCMPNIPEITVLLLALNKIGATVLMLHPLLKSEEIKAALRDINAKYIITTDTSQKEVIDAVNNTNIKTVISCNVSDSMSLLFKVGYKIKNHINKFKQNALHLGEKNIIKSIFKSNYSLKKSNDTPFKSENYKINWNKKTKKYTYNSDYTDNKVAFLLKTGGSTGIPKMASLTNENCISNIEQLKYTIPSYKAFDVIEGITPMFHGFGLVDVLFTGWSVNLTVDLHPRYDSRLFNKAVVKNNTNLILGPPTLFNAMINSNEYKDKMLPHLNNLICGSDKLDPSLRKKINEWKEQHGASNPIFIGLGLTEATAAISFTGLNSKYDTSVGFPLPCNNVKIVSLDNGKELGYNEIGELCINGPTVMLEYFNNEFETINALKEENGKIWLHTGDLCYITPNGEIIFVDRNKGIIVVSGINVYRSEIENIVNEMPEVVNCAVIGVPHSYKMNVPKAYVKLLDGVELTEELKIKFKNYCNSKLNVYQKIYEFEQIDTIPLTPLNKTDYTILEKNSKVKKLKKE